MTLSRVDSNTASKVIKPAADSHHAALAVTSDLQLPLAVDYAAAHIPSWLINRNLNDTERLKLSKVQTDVQVIQPCSLANVDNTNRKPFNSRSLCLMTLRYGIIYEVRL